MEARSSNVAADAVSTHPPSNRRVPEQTNSKLPKSKGIGPNVTATDAMINAIREVAMLVGSDDSEKSSHGRQCKKTRPPGG